MEFFLSTKYFLSRKWPKFPKRQPIDKAIECLGIKSEYPGTIIRLSAAIGLGEIIKLEIKKYADWVITIQNNIEREVKKQQ